MNKNLTDINIVLDRSGSMASVADDTIGGFNTFLEEQQKAPGDANLTLVQFDTEYLVTHNAVQIDDVPDLDRSTFVPRGMTALFDAIGRTIVTTGERLAAMPEEERPAKVIMVIITDGHENSSREYTQEQVNKLITQQKCTFSWEFVFLGANQDAIKTGGALGIPAGASMSFAANAKGTEALFSSVAQNMTNYRNASLGASYTFSAEDRAKQDDAGA